MSLLMIEFILLEGHKDDDCWFYTIVFISASKRPSAVPSQQGFTWTVPTACATVCISYAKQAKWDCWQLKKKWKFTGCECDYIVCQWACCKGNKGHLQLERVTVLTTASSGASLRSFFKQVIATWHVMKMRTSHSVTLFQNFFIIKIHNLKASVIHVISTLPHPNNTPDQHCTDSPLNSFPPFTSARSFILSVSLLQNRLP